MSNFLVWPHTVVNWMRGSVRTNYLRIGGIVAVALLAIVLAACPAPSSSSGGNGDGNGPTDPVVTIDETTDCTTDADTACTFAVGDTFTGEVGGTDDPNDWVKVTLAINTSYRITATPGTAGTTATVAMYNATATAADPNIGSDMLYTATAAAVHYIEIGLSAAGGYELTIVAAPDGEETCSSMDAEADCDGDEVLNPNDEFAHDAARSCTIVASGDGANFASTTVDCDNDDVMNMADVDDDNDGLIDIYFLDDLSNIRNNLAGTSLDSVADTIDPDGTISAGDAAGETGSTVGAPTSATTDCTTAVDSVYLCGYELMRSLDFDVQDSYASAASFTTDNSGWRADNAVRADATNAGWLPLNSDVDTSNNNFDGTPFSAILEGNGNTIANLYINRTGDSDDFVGLFGSVEGTIRRLGIVDAFVVGDKRVGGLAGNNPGTIVAGWIRGSITGNSQVGGLVGQNFGTITASWSSGSVMSAGQVGGLVGWTQGGVVSASYSTASAMSSARSAGGLVGDNFGTISASWSSGSATADSGTVGGLAGNIQAGNNVIATSYWDSTTSERLFGAGTDDPDNDNMVGSSETNQLVNQGLTTDQMRAGMGTFPDFSSVVRLVGPGTAAANLLGDFSAAWDYTANCYPRLRQWLDDGDDDTVGTVDDNFHASELLPGQGTPGTGGACTGTP